MGGPVRLLSQTRPIPRSPDGDNKPRRKSNTLKTEKVVVQSQASGCLCRIANPSKTAVCMIMRCRVAGLGSLSAGAKMAMKPFVKRVFTIFTTNASFLSVISNFRI